MVLKRDTVILVVVLVLALVVDIIITFQMVKFGRRFNCVSLSSLQVALAFCSATLSIRSR